MILPDCSIAILGMLVSVFVATMAKLNNRHRVPVKTIKCIESSRWFNTVSGIVTTDSMSIHIGLLAESKLKKINGLWYAAALYICLFFPQEWQKINSFIFISCTYL